MVDGIGTLIAILAVAEIVFQVVMDMHCSGRHGTGTGPAADHR